MLCIHVSTVLYSFHILFLLGKPVAVLKNDISDKFNLGMYDRVMFTCEAMSYPFPERIEFYLDSVLIDESTEGVHHYQTDLANLDVNAYTASFVVNNMTREFFIFFFMEGYLL